MSRGLPDESVEAAMRAWGSASVVRSDAAKPGPDRFAQKMDAALSAAVDALPTEWLEAELRRRENAPEDPPVRAHEAIRRLSDIDFH